MSESIKAMTLDEQEALSIISEFVLQTDIIGLIEDFLPNYALYHKEGNHQTAYCTSCNSEFKLSRHIILERTFASGVAKHGDISSCPLCGERITYLADGKGRRNIIDSENFVVFQAVSETQLIAKCIRVRRTFLNPNSGRYFADIDSNIFDYSYMENTRYYFEIGKKPLKFIKKATYDFGLPEYHWKKCSRFSEPVFVQSPFGGGDNCYNALRCEEIENTNFNYIYREIKNIKDDSFRHKYNTLINMPLQVLGEYAEHPQIEYILKAGFPDIVESKITHSLCGLRLNWKSNNLKKILGMTAAEISILKGWSAVEIVHYKEIKKLDKKASPEDIHAILSRSVVGGYQLYYFLRDELIGKRGLSCRTVTNYLNKCNSSLRDWQDYMSQCRQLDYDTEDPAIFKPRDLALAHERLTQVLKIRAAEELECKIRELESERKLYRFFDEEFDLILREPASVQEIIDEGRALVHCVGTYADRHVNGQLTILFVRRMERPDEPFYTMEVSNLGKIVQCRGYRNNREIAKPKFMEHFEAKYSNYLKEIFPVIEKMRKDREKELKKIEKKSKKSRKTA